MNILKLLFFKEEIILIQAAGHLFFHTLEYS